MTSLQERLTKAKMVIMDGGVSTEMECKGLAMDGDVWSGAAHITHPDLVRAVHEDYIRAGAEVITANTFSTARHVLAGIGKADDAAKITRDGIALARQARDDVATGEVWIAGSMSSMPSLEQISITATGQAAADSYREHADALAEAGCDLILAEMMIDTENAALVLDAAKATGLPLWIGRKRSFRPWNQRGRFHSPRPILAIEGAFPIPSQGPEPDILFRLVGLPVPVVAPAPLGGPDAGSSRRPCKRRRCSAGSRRRSR